MFVPGYTWDHDYVCFWAKETQSLIARNGSGALLRDVITPRQTRRFPDWASGSIPRHGGLAAFAGVWRSVASGLWRGLCPTWGSRLLICRRQVRVAAGQVEAGRVGDAGAPGLQVLCNCLLPRTHFSPSLGPLPCSVRPQLSDAHFPGRPCRPKTGREA